MKLLEKIRYRILQNNYGRKRKTNTNRRPSKPKKAMGMKNSMGSTFSNTGTTALNRRKKSTFSTHMDEMEDYIRKVTTGQISFKRPRKW